MLNWDNVKSEFVWEGSWRDLCVLDVSISHWRALVDMLRVSDVELKLTLDGEAAELPRDIGELFESAREAAALLSVFAGAVQLVCHFFDVSEIEFDLDPREIQGQAELDAVVTFMHQVAATTDRCVLMTPENMHELPFIRVGPSGTVEYISSEGFFEEMARLR